MINSFPKGKMKKQIRAYSGKTYSARIAELVREAMYANQENYSDTAVKMYGCTLASELDIDPQYEINNMLFEADEKDRPLTSWTGLNLEVVPPMSQRMKDTRDKDLDEWYDAYCKREGLSAYSFEL